MNDSVLAIESTKDGTVFTALADGFVAVLQVRSVIFTIRSCVLHGPCIDDFCRMCLLKCQTVTLC